MQKFLVTIVLSLLTYNTNSQSLKFRLSYKYTFVGDSTKPTQLKNDIMYLDIISDSGSIYYSKDVEEKRILFKKDEAIFNAMINSGVVESSKLQQYRSKGIDDIVIKNYQKRELIFATWAGLHFFYYEPITEISWEYLSDTSTVNGFFCQKAACALFGRKYEAWFCKSIDISDGPWKFRGLSGAVIKISDTDNHFKYELLEISQLENDTINLQIDDKEYKLIDKKKLLHLMKDYYEDKMGTIQRLGGFSVDKQNKTKQAPNYYNPQEK